MYVNVTDVISRNLRGWTLSRCGSSSGRRREVSVVNKTPHAKRIQFEAVLQYPPLPGRNFPRRPAVRHNTMGRKPVHWIALSQHLLGAIRVLMNVSLRVRKP